MYALWMWNFNHLLMSLSCCLEVDLCMRWGVLGVQRGIQKPMAEFGGKPKGKTAATDAGGTEHLVETGMSK